MSKGIFIEGITVEMFRNASLESVEELLAEGDMVDMEIPKWTPVQFREPNNEECKEHPDWVYVAENIPPYDEEVLVSDGKYVWTDTLLDNGDYIYWDSDHELEGTAWMALPEPYKRGEE